MEILEKLFGSNARVRLMRLFLMNPEMVFERTEILRRSRVNAAAVRKEIRLFEDVGLIKKRNILKMDAEDVPVKKKKKTLTKKSVQGYGLNTAFPFLVPLRGLVTEIALGKQDLAARFKNIGTVKLVIVAGIFIDDEDSRVDLLVVGDKLKKPNLDMTIKKLEAELGKELRFGVLTTEEFTYRLGIYDKFIRDILDYQHLVVINKLNIF